MNFYLVNFTFMVYEVLLIENSKQHVSINNFKSNKSTLTCDVPQCSALVFCSVLTLFGI